MGELTALPNNFKEVEKMNIELSPETAEYLDDLANVLGTDREGALELAVSVAGTIAIMIEVMLRRRLDKPIQKEKFLEKEVEKNG